MEEDFFGAGDGKELDKQAKGWKSLRGKFFSKEPKSSPSKAPANDQQDLADFLRPSATAAAAVAAPKLDVNVPRARKQSDASRFNPNRPVSGVYPKDLSTENLMGDDLERKWTPIKPRRREGLTVGFAPRDDDVIGEGGEEAYLPVIACSRNYTGPLDYEPPSPIEEEEESTPGSGGFPPGVRSPNEGEPPQLLLRRSTGFSDEGEKDDEAAMAPIRRVGTGPQARVEHNMDDYDSDDDDDDDDVPLKSPNRTSRGSPPPGMRPGYHRQQAPSARHMQQQRPDVSPPSPIDRIQVPGNSRGSPVNQNAPRDRPDASPSRDDYPAHVPRGSSLPLRQNEMPLPPQTSSNILQQPRTSRADASPSPDDTARTVRRKQASEGLTINPHPLQSQSTLQRPVQEHRPSSSESYNNNRSLSPVAQQPSSTRQRATSESPLPSPHHASQPQMLAARQQPNRNQPQPSPSLTPGFPNDLSAPSFLTPPSSAQPITSDLTQSQHGRSTSQESIPSIRGRASLSMDGPPQRERSRSNPLVDQYASPSPPNRRSPQRKPVPPLRGQNLPTTTKHYTNGRSGSLETETALPHPPRASPIPDGLDPKDAIQELLQRFSSMYSIFEKTATNLSEPSLDEWIRAAMWWFLRGRRGVELFADMLQSSPEGRPSSQAWDLLSQHQMNLAKGWWIASEVLPSIVEKNDPQTPSEYEKGDSVGILDNVVTKMMDGLTKLAIIMAKLSLMPSDRPSPNLNTTIWVSYPTLKPEMAWNLSGQSFMPPDELAKALRPFVSFGLGDTDFSYTFGSVFGRGTILEGDEDEYPEKLYLCCSIMRRRGYPGQGAIISSQDRSVCVPIWPRSRMGITWDHVRWDRDYAMMRVKLPHKLRLMLTFSRQDFDFLFTSFERDQKIWSSLIPRQNETLLNTFSLSSFQYIDTAPAQNFPQGKFQKCKCAVVEILVPAAGRAGRAHHGGYRLAITTDPAEKYCYGLNINLGRDAPVEYNFVPEERDQARIELRMEQKQRTQDMTMGFEHFGDRDLLRDMISGTIMTQHETVVEKIPLRSIGFVNADDPNPTQYLTVEWPSLQVIDRKIERQENSPTLMVDSLRMIMLDKHGSMVDRMSFGAGETRLRLDTKETAMLQLYRPPRMDITVAIGPEPSDSIFRQSMYLTHRLSTASSTIQSYRFQSIRDLHNFQAVVTGFKTFYDGVAATWGISRRKKGIPVYKSWDANGVRMQIVEQDGMVQLLCFFEGYILADAINFQMKKTDVFEAFTSKTNQPCVRLVDAKFVLPGTSKHGQKDMFTDEISTSEKKDVRTRFVDLENLEYAVEHEDITITFMSEADRDAFTKALPTPPTQSENFKKKFGLKFG